MKRPFMTALLAALTLATTLSVAQADTTDASQPKTQTLTSATFNLDEQMWKVGNHGSYAETASGISHFVINANRRGSRMAIVMTRKAMSYIGTPYVWGGTTPRGFDCSGFVQYAFRKIGIHVPRTADIQYAKARKFKGPPRRGDLVFFQTYAPGASHVGIYLDHGKFVQAAGHGVRVARLSDPYWKHRFIGMRRILALM